MWEDLERQAGVISRQQALQGGLTPGAIRSRLDTGKWVRLVPGVYATFTGEVTRLGRLWAAVLAAGPGALLSHNTAAELVGLVDNAEDPIHVTVPVDRKVVAIPGVRRHRSIRASSASHPTRLPPQTRVEETVVDLTQTSRTAEEAMNWIVRACARRLTTVDRLRTGFEDRNKLRWRAPVTALLKDVEAGCHSMLELAYLRQVERAHGLPAAHRQVVRLRRGGRWYDDVRYNDYATVVELDGQAAHPVYYRGRDALRDNAGVAEGLAILRYSAIDVASRPCHLAAEVGTVIHRNGWLGQLRRCGPNCQLPA